MNSLPTPESLPPLTDLVASSLADESFEVPFSKERLAILLRYIGAGYPLRMACALCGLDESSYDRWRCGMAQIARVIDVAVEAARVPAIDALLARARAGDSSAWTAWLRYSHAGGFGTAEARYVRTKSCKHLLDGGMMVFAGELPKLRKGYHDFLEKGFARRDAERQAARSAPPEPNSVPENRSSQPEASSENRCNQSHELSKPGFQNPSVSPSNEVQAPALSIPVPSRPIQPAMATPASTQTQPENFAAAPYSQAAPLQSTRGAPSALPAEFRLPFTGQPRPHRRMHGNRAPFDARRALCLPCVVLHCSHPVNLVHPVRKFFPPNPTLLDFRTSLHSSAATNFPPPVPARSCLSCPDRRAVTAPRLARSEIPRCPTPAVQPLEPPQAGQSMSLLIDL